MSQGSDVELLPISKKPAAKVEEMTDLAKMCARTAQRKARKTLCTKTSCTYLGQKQPDGTYIDNAMTWTVPQRGRRSQTLLWFAWEIKVDDET
eukprot:297047-Karenia_brevis.AAC.1